MTRSTASFTVPERTLRVASRPCSSRESWSVAAIGERKNTRPAPEGVQLSQPASRLHLVFLGDGVADAGNEQPRGRRRNDLAVDDHEIGIAIQRLRRDLVALVDEHGRVAGSGVRGGGRRENGAPRGEPVREDLGDVDRLSAADPQHDRRDPIRREHSPRTARQRPREDRRRTRTRGSAFRRPPGSY